MFRGFVVTRLATLPVAGLLLLSACGAARPTAAPAKTSSAPAASRAASAGGQSAGSQGEWDKTVAAAKQEGTVSIISPPGAATRAALVDPFEKAYPGITVDATAMRGGEATTRVTSERQAGKYLWDLFVNGVTEVLTGFIPDHAVDSLDPALILSDVRNPKTWRDGAIEYMDQGHMAMVMAKTIYPTIWVNSTTVKPDQLKSFKDFLQPSWKGKIVMDDPTKPGPGQALLTEWYLTPALGEDYIRAMAKQQPLILRDFTQEANMVGQGKYPVLLGGSDQTLAPLIKKGVPIAVIPPEQLKEPPQVAAGAAAVAIFNHPAHPNAAKVYLNWLLSKDGQYSFSESQVEASNRVDVSTDYLDSWRVPVPGAIKTYGPDSLAVRDKVNALAKEVFPQ